MDVMLIISIMIEAAVCVIAFLAARRSSVFIYGLSLTFGIYVVYDLVRLMGWSVDGRIISSLFLVACISALIAVSCLYFSSGKRA
jgi:hypothetical protein